MGENGALILLQDEDKRSQTAVSAKEVNFISTDVLTQLRKRKVCYIKHKIGIIPDNIIVSSSLGRRVLERNADGHRRRREEANRH